MSDVLISAEGFTVDAGIVGAAFGLEAAAVPVGLRAGEITSRCEMGVNEDAGRWRLTFFRSGRALRLTVDGNGAILSRATFASRPPAPR